MRVKLFSQIHLIICDVLPIYAYTYVLAHCAFLRRPGNLPIQKPNYPMVTSTN